MQLKVTYAYEKCRQEPVNTFEPVGEWLKLRIATRIDEFENFFHIREDLGYCVTILHLILRRHNPSAIDIYASLPQLDIWIGLMTNGRECQ